MRTFTAGALALMFAAMLAACNGGSQPSSAPQQTSPPAALKNPTNFPLVEGATILDVKPFEETVSGVQLQTSALRQGAGTYTGMEVLAESDKSVDALRRWLASVGHNPPPGYVYETGSATATGDTARTLDLYGIGYGAFRSGNAAVNRGVAVVVMDPKVVREKLGIALDLIDRYRSLPAALRDPIDQQFKQKSGFTITQATDPSSPLGMTLSALQELQNSDARAIVLIEGTKK